MNYDKMFKDEREKGETPLKQCQLVLTRMFKIFDHLCTKHQIPYFLCNGSLLGAVRNRGILPWDDDLDVGLTRRNYERFVKLAVPELSNDIFFQTPETDPDYPACHIVEAKLRDKYSSYTYHKRKRDGRHTGLMLDLIVFDRAYLPHNLFIYAMNKMLMFFFKKRGDKKRANVLKWIERYSPIRLVYSCSGLCQWKKIKKGPNYFLEKEISKLLKVPFEDMEAYIPAGWHNYLKRKHGPGYIQPPVEKQVTQHGDGVPDAFRPSNHKHTLLWSERNKVL